MKTKTTSMKKLFGILLAFVLTAGVIMATAIIVSAGSVTEINKVEVALHFPHLGDSHCTSHGVDACVVPLDQGHYQIKNAHWYNGGTMETNEGCGLAPGSFVVGKPYFAEFDLVPESGYIFDPNTTVTLNGAGIRAFSVRDGGMTIHVTTVDVIASENFHLKGSDKFPVQVVVSTRDKNGEYTPEKGGTAVADKKVVKRGDKIEVKVNPYANYGYESIDFGSGLTGGFQSGSVPSAFVPADFDWENGCGYCQIDVTFREIETEELVLKENYSASDKEWALVWSAIVGASKYEVRSRAVGETEWNYVATLPWTGYLQYFYRYENANLTGTGTYEVIVIALEEKAFSQVEELATSNSVALYRMGSIQFDLNGGTSGAPGDVFGKLGSMVTIPNEKPVRTGWEFKGWAFDANATTASYHAGDTVAISGDIVLHAVWEPKTAIISAKAQYASIAKTSQQEFKVVATTNVNYLMLYAEDGKTLVKSWPAAGNCVMDGDRRIWTVSHAISNPGDRKLIFKGGTTSTTPVTNAVTVSFKVLNTGVISASAKNDDIKKGGEQVFTVKTTSDAKYLMEYAEGGNLVKTWTADSNNSTVSGNVRTWTVKQKIQTPGYRELTFKAGGTSTPTAAQRMVAFIVEDSWVNSASVKYAVMGRGGVQTFTAKTTANAKELVLWISGDAHPIATWNASGNSTVSGDVRTWTVDLIINYTGDIEYFLTADEITIPEVLGKKVKSTVVEKKIVSANAKYAAITKTSVQGFTVKTSSDVQYLMMYAEGGNLVKSWPASGNSTVGADNIRTWYVMQAINTAGNRKLVFKGGTTNTTPVTNAMTASFKVENTGVLTVSAKNATITKGSKQTFTVTTTADCKYLAEYAENGNLVTSWTANSSNSKVSGNVRTWTVTQTINTAGKRTLTFKAGVSSPTAAERNVSFTVK